jgi:hypothetical protein
MNSTAVYKFSRVTPWWVDSDFKSLNYEYSPVRNQQDTEKWTAAGLGKLTLFGAVYDSTKPLPACAEKFLHLFDWQNVTISFLRLNTLEALPTHQDAFINYRKIFNVTDPHLLWRCVVFMEDWKSGHYFEIADQGVVNWRRGDYVVWNYDVPHYAGNFGVESRYTLQITGTQRQ